MKLLLAICLAVLVSISQCGEISNLIVNGEDASVQDHPYMAKVWVASFPMCGSAILNTRSVLTAAHCLIGPVAVSVPLSVSVVVGSSYRNGNGGQRYLVGRIFYHPDYVPGQNIYDVAIVRTFSRIQFNQLVQPIQLAENFIGVGETGTFIGWGFVGYGPILPIRANVLQRMNITTIANNDCKERYSVTHRGEFIVDQKLCVVSGPRTSVCGGDSGGAVVINGRVAGVLSWRTFPCGDGLPDVFIRTSAVRDWILSII